METLKEKWIRALNNPYYILAWVAIIAFIIFLFVSCTPKACPAYTKEFKTEKNKNI